MLKHLIPAMLLLLGAQAWAAEALQTQYHDSGAEVHAVKAKVADGVLTVIIRYQNDTGGKIEEDFPLSEVYYIDPEENKKYSVLRDENGKWIANPVNNQGKIGVVGRDWGLDIENGQAKIMWFKFPEPASDSDTINFVVPNVTPFDGLAISR